MDRNLVLFAGIIAALTAGAGIISAAVSAHMFGAGYQFNASDPEFAEHYAEMSELHRQYYEGEISLEEFEQQMLNESEEMHGEGFGCSGGFGMMGW